METNEQRQARRTISGWLTKQVNSSVGVPYDRVRGKVLQALQRIDERLFALNESLHEQFGVRADKPLVKFYMKGGNAFACVNDVREGRDVWRLGGGDSDWDTQIVVDPWAPLPLQDQLYARVQEIVMEEMVSCGAEIAETIGPLNADLVREWNQERGQLNQSPTNQAGDNLDNFDITYDEQQTVRQVYDPDRVGLWMNDRRKLKDPTGHKPMRVPGIIFNDAIRPFAIYRLGYTWHASHPPAPIPAPPPPPGAPALAQVAAPGGQPVQPGGAVAQAVLAQPGVAAVPVAAPAPAPRAPKFTCDIEKPILMELIDVTLPRRNTIEAVAVWEELAQGHVTVAKYPVRVASIPPVATTLPLPDINYHVREICTMLCEVADGSSHHKDKLIKRFDRFRTIWNKPGIDQARIRHEVSAMAGVENIDRENPANQPSVTQDITDHAARVLNNPAPADVMVRKLMDIVAARTQEAGNGFAENGSVSGLTLQRFDAARVALRALLNEALKLPKELVGATEAAWSDDLALLKLVEEHEYLDPRKVGFSSVDQAAVVRVPNQLALDTVTNAMLVALDPKKLEPGFEGPEPPTKVRFREHTTVRRGSISFEKTFVIFRNGRAEAYITFTTAGAADAPFNPAPGDSTLKFAALAEIASQRKVAAALIEDYVVRTAIGRQYEALKTLLHNV